MSTIARKRQADIDILRCVGICLVVLGHSFPTDVLKETPWLIHFFRSFTMPLFMVISGYLYIYAEGGKKGYYRFVIGKVKLLLVPYILLSNIAFIPKALLAHYAERPIDLSWSYWVKSLLYPTENVIIYFWFMPTLFLISICGPLFNWAIRYRLAAVVLTLVLALLHLTDPLQGVLLLNLAGVSHYILFFWLGSLLASGKARTERFIEAPILLPFLLILQVLLYLAMEKAHLIIELPLALIGTAMAFSFGKWYVRQRLNWFRWLHGYTYQIYLLSWFPQVFVMIISLKVLQLPYNFTVAAMFISGLLLPVLAARLINLYCPFFNIAVGLKPRGGKLRTVGNTQLSETNKSDNIQIS
ncbi:acyltransferase family protein [Paenibacillus agricola]|uniref:Acyltransferase n=1 Tax=Paenibacillus agricola TaxID=2716264 RepID=A0ABX0J1Q5_9BACL|nr:acyltransferase [Paenibacillus agricola]NHN29380.1 acyltransferase [Paenibacillus agricola]